MVDDQLDFCDVNKQGFFLLSSEPKSFGPVTLGGIDHKSMVKEANSDFVALDCLAMAAFMGFDERLRLLSEEASRVQNMLIQIEKSSRICSFKLRKAHHLNCSKIWATLTVTPFFKVDFEGLENLPTPDLVKVDLKALGLVLGFSYNMSWYCICESLPGCVLLQMYIKKETKKVIMFFVKV